MNDTAEFFDGEEHTETPQAQLTRELQTAIEHHTHPRNEYVGTLVARHEQLGNSRYERFIPLKYGDVTMNLAISCMEKDGDISQGDVHIYLNEPTEHSYVWFDEDGKAKKTTTKGKLAKDVWYGDFNKISPSDSATDLTLDQLQRIKTILQQGNPDAESLRKTVSENPSGIHGRGGMYRMRTPPPSPVKDAATLSLLRQPFSDIATAFCSETLPKVVDNVFSANKPPEMPQQQ